MADEPPSKRSKKDDAEAEENDVISKLVTKGLWDDDPLTVESALTELANLCYDNPKSAPNRGEISLTGGLLAITKALAKYAENDKVQAAGGRALQNLAIDPKCKGGIVSSGGMECIVNAMKSFPEDVGVQCSGCGTLQNLVWGKEENRLKLLEAGAIPVVVRAMQKHPKEAELQEYACGTFDLLAHGEAELKEAVIDSKGLTSIVAAIENHRDHDGVQKKGRHALFRLLM